jgi:hypothetical protein
MSSGWILVLMALGLVTVISALMFFYQRQLEIRRDDLTRRFRPEIAELIMAKKIRQGMTEEMLKESWGPPANVDQEVFKTKLKQTWKYNQIGKNRFANRVFVENGFVVGWKDA